MKHLKIWLLIACSLIVFTEIEAQPSKELSQEKMEYFKMMLGEWQGIAKKYTKEGMISVHQHEYVEYKLGETLMLVEGTGKDDKGNVVFNALGNIFYDFASDQLKMHAFLDNGSMTEAIIEIIDEQTFEWGFSPNEFTHIKYETKIFKGVWIEKGYYSQDKENWMPIFEMELKKIK